MIKKVFKKKDASDTASSSQQITVEQNTQTSQADTQPAQNSKPKKMSKLKILSIIWTVLMFGFYIFKDALRIKSNGWDAINIITTAFLAVQIILFVVFTIAGSKSKLQSKRQKNTKKWVKKLKKLSIKITTLVTSILIIAGTGLSDLGITDIIAIIVAGLSLLLFVISLIKTLVMDIIKYKIAKKNEERKAQKALKKAGKSNQNAIENNPAQSDKTSKK